MEYQLNVSIAITNNELSINNTLVGNARIIDNRHDGSYHRD